MRELAERVWFALCLTLGRLLRSGRYSSTRIVRHGGEVRVLKRRRLYAPLLVSIGRPFMRILDTGVRVLPQREWEEHERVIYQTLYGCSIRTDASGELTLPCLTGRTLAALLEDRALDAPTRSQALELAVAALASFHARGFTHGDAMAENVMVDLEAGTAHWFDFETLHDPTRSLSWRRADDLRALLATCLRRVPPDEISGTLIILLDGYGDDTITPLVATSFTSVMRRSLAFHLGQAPLSIQCYRNIARTVRSHRPKPWTTVQ